ncbi:MAG: Rieske 2Fe-2S domain-containing protein, partial [Alphaproteobacteria bacterium]|nr:Rieske 2Fe-2S domain-containing protein [Alphaproteobacteria bacterium]
MLSRDENDLLTQTSSGTPMGDYMRRFWMPVMLAEELGEPDSAPVRVRLLGEDLIAFRDTKGRVGLVDRYCPHRRANLFFGRNEDCGIRCIYHGWKFDVDGNCVDLPSEPPESRFREKVRLTAYPTTIKGGVLWAYMGPAEKRGEVPDFGWMDLPESHIYRSRWIQQCNYAQAVEGEIDSAHVSFLHSLVDTNDTNNAALAGSYFSNDTAPKWKVIERDHGIILGARRVVENARYYWRMNQWYHPFYT